MEDNDKMSVSNSEHIETGNSIGTCPMNECFEYRKMVFKECALAGVSFHLKKDDEIWYELELGAELALVRDRKNKYDLNAVAVCLADDYDGNPDDFDFNFILGYVPRTDNAELAALLDAGYGDKLSAEITTLCNYGNINDRIRITIYIETSQPVFVRPDLLRAHSLNSHELNVLIVTIAHYGTYYYRVGGFPTDERTLPTVGEKIVMVYEQPHDSRRCVSLPRAKIADDSLTTKLIALTIALLTFLRIFWGRFLSQNPTASSFAVLMWATLAVHIICRRICRMNLSRFSNAI